MYTLIRTPPDRLLAPDLDASQQAVVDHPGGPLLVLAGPGTGKTTTLVESVVDRIERRGLTPGQILVLTFSRKAAADLRSRIAGPTRPVGGDADGVHVPCVLLRAGAPVRRTGRRGGRHRAATASADRAGAGVPAAGVAGGQSGRPEQRRGEPDRLARQPGPRVRDPGVRRGGARRTGQGAPTGHGPGRHRGGGGGGGATRVAGDRGVLRRVPRRARRRAGARLRRTGAPESDPARRPGRRRSASQRTQMRLRRRIPRHRPGPGEAAAGDRRGRPGRRGGRRPGPVGVRVPRRRGARHPRLPRRLPDRDRDARAGRGPGYHPAVRYRPARGQPQHRCSVVVAARRCRRRCCARSGSRSRHRVCRGGRWRRSRVRPRAPRRNRSPNCSARRTCGRAFPGRRWPCWCGPGGG